MRQSVGGLALHRQPEVDGTHASVGHLAQRVTRYNNMIGCFVGDGATLRMCVDNNDVSVF